MTIELAGGRPAEILLVEDNEHDVILTREGFKEAHFLVNLHHVENGKRCMEFLRKEAEFGEAPTPDLILLDLNMPVMNGREVLEQIVADPNLQHLPVVVLTTSAQDREVLDIYKLRCSSYIAKPVDFERFIEVIQGIGNYWFTMVVLPHERN